MLPARRALVSVSDKKGLEELGRDLDRLGIEIVSTGGTLAFLRERGIPALAVSEVTGFPEILDGRVKTLHPRIHGGILANRSVPAHADQLAAHDIGRIDLVIVNLYPFRETAADAQASFEEVVEKIDVGGPAMVRAAAKNFAGVAVVVDPDDYSRLVDALAASGGTLPEPLRRELALKAFRHTQSYDGAVADWLARHQAARASEAQAGEEGAAARASETQAGEEGAAARASETQAGEEGAAARAIETQAGEEGAAARTIEAAAGDLGGADNAGDAGAAGRDGAFPSRLTLDLQRAAGLRYGENPHQPAAVYAVRDDGEGGRGSLPPTRYRVQGGGALGGYRQLGGKEISWNNLLDADAARKMVALYEEPAVVIVKHNNPCGVGRGADLAEAYGRAVATDPVSAFGSVIAVNRRADGRLAAAMANLFVEVLLAPAFDDEALGAYRKKQSLRLLECPPYDPQPLEVELRAIAGGFLAQPPDALADDPAAWTLATRRAPTAEERRALEFAWRVARHVKSNAIVIANGDQTVGIGAGQMSRVDSCRLAIEKARLPLAGTVAASDAFFPFRDGLEVLAAAGVRAVVQPGGSKRDGEVVAAADARQVAMLLTGTRHFRH